MSVFLSSSGGTFIQLLLLHFYARIELVCTVICVFYCRYMGIGLSAQGVNLNRLPGIFNIFLYGSTVYLTLLDIWYALPFASAYHYFESSAIDHNKLLSHVGSTILWKIFCVGWEKQSYGYHGDDGNSFSSSGTGKPYGPTFTTGDVIGCGVNMIDNTAFYTKNGIKLGKGTPNMITLCRTQNLHNSTDHWGLCSIISCLEKSCLPFFFRDCFYRVTCKFWYFFINQSTLKVYNYTVTRIAWKKQDLYASTADNICTFLAQAISNSWTSNTRRSCWCKFWTTSICLWYCRRIQGTFILTHLSWVCFLWRITPIFCQKIHMSWSATCVCSFLLSSYKCLEND